MIKSSAYHFERAARYKHLASSPPLIASGFAAEFAVRVIYELACFFEALAYEKMLVRYRHNDPTLS